jgi:uncharacterized membrane protein
MSKWLRGKARFFAPLLGAAFGRASEARATAIFVFLVQEVFLRSLIKTVSLFWKYRKFVQAVKD